MHQPTSRLMRLGAWTQLRLPGGLELAVRLIPVNCCSPRLLQVQETETGKPKVTIVSELSQHLGSVNCVRFSPNGKNCHARRDFTLASFLRDHRTQRITRAALSIAKNHVRFCASGRRIVSWFFH